MDKKLIAPGVWNVIPGGMSAAYLILGSERALLVDSGAGEVDVKSVCAGITELPIAVVNTHYHDDHTAANGAFGGVYMHPADISRLSDGSGIVPVREGHVFELGGRSLEVIEIPGHTPGGIALYDRAAGLMFTGDTVGRLPVFLVPGDFDLDAFESSLNKLLKYDADMYGAHDAELNRRETLEKQLETLRLYRAGKLEGRKSPASLPGKVYISDNGTGFLRPDEQ